MRGNDRVSGVWMARKSSPKKENEFIFVIAGQDESSVSIEAEKVVDGLLEPGQRATGLFKTDGGEVSAAEVLDELRTVPFLTEKRVVLIKGADDFISRNRPLLEKYFENPCATGVLVMTVGNWDARTRLAKMLPGVGRLISVTEPKRWELPGRLIRYAADAYGKSLTKEAAETLVELSGDNLGQLYTEVDKLAVFVGAERVITHSHVESLTGHNRLFGVFDVIDAVVAGDKAGALNRLRAMFAGDKSEEYKVVGAFAYHFRRMFNARVLLEDNVRPDEIATQLRIWSNRDGFFAQLRKVTLKQLGAGLKRLAAIDYAIKTGRARPQVVMEQFVLKLAGG